MRWDALEINVVFLECLFKFIGALIVKDMEVWGVAMGLQFGVQLGPASGELGGLACLEGLGKDGVAIIVVEDHDIVVPPRRLDWELAGLIGV
jgi:hypothetical protein